MTPPTLPLPSVVLFKCILFILLLQSFAVSEEADLQHLSPQISTRDFTGLKFSLEYVNIYILLLIVYLSVSMTAGQLASSLSFFIKHMTTDTENCSELHKCAALRLQLPFSPVMSDHAHFILHMTAADPRLMRQALPLKPKDTWKICAVINIFH